METFPQNLILLLSVDIVSSAEFKAKSSSRGECSDWVMAFESFYEQIPLILERERQHQQLADDLELWKSIGDQLVFLMRPRSAEQLEAECFAFLRGLRTASERMMERWGFALHGVAWAFPEGAENVTFRFHRAQLGQGIGFDLIGPDVDLGFRLVSLAPNGTVLAPLSLRSWIPQSRMTLQLIGEAELKGINLTPYPLLQMVEL